jgi:hypothetical protein
MMWRKLPPLKVSKEGFQSQCVVDEKLDDNEKDSN